MILQPIHAIDISYFSPKCKTITFKEINNKWMCQINVFHFVSSKSVFNNMHFLFQFFPSSSDLKGKVNIIVSRIQPPPST